MSGIHSCSSCCERPECLKAQRNELLVALKHTLKCLQIANERGDINDTLWAGDAETLVDYIQTAIENVGGSAQ